jgi:hypothetical protein
LAARRGDVAGHDGRRDGDKNQIVFAVSGHRVEVWVCVSAFIPSPFRGGRTPLLEADGKGERLINHERTQEITKNKERIS